MIKIRNLAALLALSGVAVLPACSMFGGDSSSRSSRASYSSQRLCRRAELQLDVSGWQVPN